MFSKLLLFFLVCCCPLWGSFDNSIAKELQYYKRNGKIIICGNKQTQRGKIAAIKAFDQSFHVKAVVPFKNSKCLLVINDKL